MGRRKIAIQPIVNERNRSVTFLKRKNGLFKKAYELGVLCSVDVAVIIFEERPGHHLKLYQYCSSDIHEVVQRQLRHDGEKDTQGPLNFSGNNLSKIDDIGEGDDDDDEDDVPVRPKRRNDGKLKPPGDMSLGNSDLDYTRPMSVPQPPIPMASSHPISNDRISGSHKRPRLDTVPQSRSPPDDYSYHPSPISFSRGQQPGGYSQHGPRGSSHHQHHPTSSSQYAAFFPGSGHTPPPPSFIPLQSDFNPPPRSSTRSSGFGPPPPPKSAGSSNSSNYDSGMYAHHQLRQGPPSGGGSGGGGGGQSDLFVALNTSGTGLDWPVHGPGSNASNPAPNPPPSSSSTPSGAANESGNGGGNWLDFLSGNNPAPSGSHGNTGTSWERGDRVSGGGGGVADITEMFGGGGDGRRGPSPLVVSISGGGKRGDGGVGILNSPVSQGGVREEKG